MIDLLGSVRLVGCLEQPQIRLLVGLTPPRINPMLLTPPHPGANPNPFSGSPTGSAVDDRFASICLARSVWLSVNP